MDETKYITSVSSESVLKFMLDFTTSKM